MYKNFRAALVVATVVAAASASQAQTVAMYGVYGESNGIIVNIPQNPPIVNCVPPPLTVAPPAHATVLGAQNFQHVDLRGGTAKDARCHARGQHLNFNVTPMEVFNKPRVGSKGARNINNPAGGLAVGDPFTIPPFAFQQQLGPQVGIVLNNTTRQLDTTFIAAMPGDDRNGPFPGPLAQGLGSYTLKTANEMAPIPALTRMFSQMNWNNAGNGQNNGLPTGMGLLVRQNANTTIMAQALPNNEKMRMRYVAGPRQFGGTMALLLDGRGRLYIDGAGVTSMIPASFKPAVAAVPVGDNDPGYRRRNGAGWDVTAPGFQLPGVMKAFQLNNATPMGAPRKAPPCTQTADPTNLLPLGCNEINGFDTYMSGMAPLGPSGIIAQIPKATSVKHMFAFTTGTVSIVRVANRVVPGLGTVHFSDTVTGMGYDTVGVSAMGGVQRNVGLVAGSYTIRTATDVQLNFQMVGLDLKFTPEPAATAALASGLGLLGLLGYRRRA